MFTYDVVSESVRNPHELAAELTRRSEQGWEIVEIVYDGASWLHAFIRHTGRVSVAPNIALGDGSATNTSAENSPSVDNSTAAGASTVVTAATATTVISPDPHTSSTGTDAGSVPEVPANWYKDPSGRFELRYWNGTAWTEHVATGGRQSVDPPRA